jgi:DNA-binding transcriptional regulator YiaG
MAKKKTPAHVRIKEARARRKLSQQAFGDLVGAGASRVSEWESGRHSPSSDHRIAIERLTASWGAAVRVEDW